MFLIPALNVTHVIQQDTWAIHPSYVCAKVVIMIVKHLMSVMTVFLVWHAIFKTFASVVHPIFIWFSTKSFRNVNVGLDILQTTLSQPIKHLTEQILAQFALIIAYNVLIAVIVSLAICLLILQMDNATLYAIAIKNIMQQAALAFKLLMWCSIKQVD